MTLLRAAAIAIAIAGAIDPAVTLSGAGRARIAIVAAPEGTAIRGRLVADLSGTYDIAPQITSDAAAAVVIGDRYPDEPVPDGLLVSTVTLPRPATTAVRIARVDAPGEIPIATAIHLDVELEAHGTAGQTSDVVAVIDGLEAGGGSHRWTQGETRAHVPIEAVPVGEPPYLVQVRLKPDPTKASVASGEASEGPVGSGFSRAYTNAADVLVNVRRTPFRVEFFDPRPSWASTFLRRALEADARFQVAAIGFTSRGVSTTTGGAVPLADPRIDAFDILVTGGLDRLSAADTRALDRFMRERGGTVVVVPDQRVDPGAARDLIAMPDVAERLLEQPAKLTVTAPAASLQASELLVFPATPPGLQTLARVPGSDRAGGAVVVSVPRGDGRLVISGAMDAWRFRAADNGSFDRFWQATIAGLALDVPPPIALSVDPPLLRPGETGHVIVRVQAHDAPVSASVDGEQAIRLLPDAEAGVYRGRFVAGNSAGRSTIRVQAGALSVSKTMVVKADVSRVDSAGPALSMLATSHRGIDVTPDRLAEAEQFIRTSVAAPRTRQAHHPMRSTWWILPFAVCLSAEWWLRRRRGLR
jgi:hypothetical protein